MKIRLPIKFPSYLHGRWININHCFINLLEPVCANVVDRYIEFNNYRTLLKEHRFLNEQIEQSIERMKNG